MLLEKFNKKVKSRLSFWDRVVSKLDNDIAKRVGMNPDVFRSLMPGELWLDAEDSVNTNFSDKICTISLDIYKTDSDMLNQLSKNSPLKDKITINIK